jgi:hypothetical protein
VEVEVSGVMGLKVIIGLLLQSSMLMGGIFLECSILVVEIGRVEEEELRKKSRARRVEQEEVSWRGKLKR